MRAIIICFIFGFILSMKAYSQGGDGKEVAYKIIAEGVDSPISDLQIVCYNKYFNKDYLPDEFRKRYNLDEKSLYKKSILIEIFHSDDDQMGFDKIELIGIQEKHSKLVIEYNLINSDKDNDDRKLSPFLIVKTPKSKKEIKFIVNGTELGGEKEIYVD